MTSDQLSQREVIKVTDTSKMFTDGAAYERMMGRWSRLAGRPFLDWLNAPRGLRWLDVGCGNGAFTQTLIAQAAPATVAAIDPSPGQILYAKEQTPLDQVDFSVGDAQALPFADAAFDATIMALVLSFVPDPQKAVCEMARVTQPGGYVGAYMWESADTAPVGPITLAARALGHDGDYPLLSARTASQSGMRSLWSEAGLMDIETRRIDISVSFGVFADFWDSFHVRPNPATRFMENLGEAEVEAIRRWLRDFLPTDRLGRISYTASASAVKGRVTRTAERG